MTWLPSCSLFPVRGMIGAPLGWRDLLKRRPDLSSAKFRPTIMNMSVKQFLQLSQVQTGVNNRVRYRHDVYPNGRPGDKWEVAGTEGDCEDFALAKMVRGLDFGWPRGALRLTLCSFIERATYLTGIKPQLIYHAVLQVDTDHGTWVLDNRMKYPRRWTRLPYRWLWREKAGSEEWERYDDPLKKELDQ